MLEPQTKDGSHLSGKIVSIEDVTPLLVEIERKDMTTAAHTWRVTLYARRVAEEFGLAHDFIERLCKAAALHDVGKLEIPIDILQKPGRLTDDEFVIIKTHTTRGYDFLRSRGVEDEAVLNLVRHHHERVDGKGYPDGLVGDAIAPGPRMFAVIDSFDAMTSLRSYRKEVGEGAAEAALEELHNGSGTRYDPDAVDMFTRLYRTGELNWILHYFNDECPVPAISELARVGASRGGA